MDAATKSRSIIGLMLMREVVSRTITKLNGTIEDQQKFDTRVINKVVTKKED